MPITERDINRADDHGGTRVRKIRWRHPLAGRTDPVHAEPHPGPDGATPHLARPIKAFGGGDGGPITGLSRAASVARRLWRRIVDSVAQRRFGAVIGRTLG
ncbi:hypothetical protein Ait01nite_101200 [Actinoplanes italicus]|nr:hypothetical protein Ait01nite_101200 [Actinoplanes italicus]